MSRMTNLERLVHYQDELAALRSEDSEDTERIKQLEKQIKKLNEILPKYRPHVYRNIREGKNFGKIK